MKKKMKKKEEKRRRKENDEEKRIRPNRLACLVQHRKSMLGKIRTHCLM